MEGGGLITQAFVYLVAAVLSVPIAKRLGLGSVLGYLTAGALIGPFVLGWVGDTKDVMHVAEFGVVLMLFLVGLELKPSVVWSLRKSILGLGGCQVVVTATAIGAVAMLAGLPWQSALAIGLILAMSSTAIVLQSLAERGLMQTGGGESAFSVLLFQDIAVIPILALLPLLAMQGAADPGQTAGDGHGAALAGLQGWQQALVIVAVIATIVLAGRYLTRPAFRFVAESQLRELFTASALLLVIGVALGMEMVGLSPALGTFLAGVVLADNEYRHELETDIEPFKGLLLGLFFISVGASIDFALLLAQPILIGLLVLGLVAIKFIVLYLSGTAFRLPGRERFLFAFSLAQGGEFAFVLLAFATQNRVLNHDITALAVVVVALSMAVSPLLMILNERVVQPRFRQPALDREADRIDPAGSSVIIAGFGRFGQIVGRLLLANGIRTIVLDHDAGRIDTLRKFGFKVFYGDATRLDLLRAAGAETAKLLVIAIDDQERSLELIREVKKHFPALHILARATDLVHAYEILNLGVDTVHRETFGSALELGGAALERMGFRAYQANRAMLAFRHHNERALRELSTMRSDRKAYISRRVQMEEELERILEQAVHAPPQKGDNAWDAMPPGAK